MAYIVLGIDNDQELLDTIENYIAKHRGDVTFLRSKNISETLEIIKHKPIDLVVSEYYLLDGSGIELVLGIQKIHPYLPIFFYSTLEDDKLIREIHRKTRYIDFLTKPCIEVDFISTLDYGLGLSMLRLVRNSFTVEQRFVEYTFYFDSFLRAAQIKGKKQVMVTYVIDKRIGKLGTILLKNMSLTKLKKIIGNQAPVGLSDRSNLVNTLMILGVDYQQKALILKYDDHAHLGGKGFQKILKEKGYI